MPKLHISVEARLEFAQQPKSPSFPMCRVKPKALAFTQIRGPGGTGEHVDTGVDRETLRVFEWIYKSQRWTWQRPRTRVIPSYFKIHRLAFASAPHTCKIFTNDNCNWPTKKCIDKYLFNNWVTLITVPNT